MFKTLFKQKKRTNPILCYKRNNLYYPLIKDDRKELENYRNRL